MAANKTGKYAISFNTNAINTVQSIRFFSLKPLVFSQSILSSLRTLHEGITCTGYFVGGVSLLYFIFVTTIALFSENQVNWWFWVTFCAKSMSTALKCGPEKCLSSRAAPPQCQYQFFFFHYDLFGSPWVKPWIHHKLKMLGADLPFFSQKEKSQSRLPATPCYFYRTAICLCNGKEKCY